MQIFGNDTDRSKCKREEIKNKVHLGNSWYLLVQNRLSSRSVSQNIKSDIYGTLLQHLKGKGKAVPLQA